VPASGFLGGEDEQPRAVGDLAADRGEDLPDPLGGLGGLFLEALDASGDLAELVLHAVQFGFER
jgi:hypothetical protein